MKGLTTLESIEDCELMAITLSGVIAADELRVSNAFFCSGEKDSGSRY